MGVRSRMQQESCEEALTKKSKNLVLGAMHANVVMMPDTAPEEQ